MFPGVWSIQAQFLNPSYFFDEWMAVDHGAAYQGCICNQDPAEV